MAELIQTPEFGLNVGDMEIDRKTGQIHKRVARVPDFIGGFDHPTSIDAYYLVKRSIDWLTDEGWSFVGMIPQCSVRIVESKGMGSDSECWIDMDFIEGQSLSQMRKVPGNVANQLAEFLNGCVMMAKATKKEIGKVIIPDLLGGVQKPHDKFMNFIVEKETGKLFFVDVYPLAEFGRGWFGLLKKRYKSSLTEAARAVSHPGVVAAVERLKTVL